MKTNQIYSIRFVIKRGKSKNGKAPVVCRITVNGKRVEIAMKKSIEPGKWSVASGRAKGNSEEARVINTHIDLTTNEIMRHHNKLVMEGKPTDAQSIKNSFLGLSEKKYSLIETFNYHNERMKAVIGIDVELGTYKKFETVLGKIKRFIEKFYNREDLYLDELNFKFITDFEYFMKTEDSVKHNTALRYIRCLKKIIILALNNEWISRNPFANYKCQYTRVNREVLTEEELSALWKKDIGIPRLDEVKDIFMFCCYTGYAFIDVEKLSRKDLARGIDGDYWIFTERKKTGVTSNVPMLPKALEIIQKYSDHKGCINDDKLLPVKSNQKMNAYLKEVATLCGISKNLTMHMARHTFATTVTLSNGVPIETVSKMLGHTKLATTQIYAQVLDNKVSHDMSALREKMSLKTECEEQKKLS
ncbi:MAG: site-specific integrase [Crocinitomicaceae bacterium]|nr:site-specific integrase [Crocinitomicaceae bacterium]